MFAEAHLLSVNGVLEASCGISYVVSSSCNTTARKMTWCALLSIRSLGMAPRTLMCSQVLSRVVSTGLDGRKLRATFKEADQLDYQDSLGQLVLGVAHTVPDGVLLFLPSYALMEKLTKRWQVGWGGGPAGFWER